MKYLHRNVSCVLMLSAVLIGAWLSSEAANAAIPKIVVRASATVQNDYITLGDIADITPSPKTSKASARLAETVVGRSPMPGATRPLERGDVILKLRQAGVDPNTVSIEGAESLIITDIVSVDRPGSNTAPASVSPAVSAASVMATTASSVVQVTPTVAAAPAVRPGDPVDIVLVDGPVTVRAKGYAINGGSLGSAINIRRDDAIRPFAALIIGADQVQLEE